MAFSVSPTGGDTSVGAAVAEAIRVVRASGLPNETNAMLTNIEGEWDEVMAVVKQAVDAVAAVSDRLSLVLKADIVLAIPASSPPRCNASKRRSATEAAPSAPLVTFRYRSILRRRFER